MLQREAGGKDGSGGGGARPPRDRLFDRKPDLSLRLPIKGLMQDAGDIGRIMGERQPAFGRKDGRQRTARAHQPLLYQHIHQRTEFLHREAVTIGQVSHIGRMMDDRWQRHTG
jgi:hypothetical protein